MLVVAVGDQRLLVSAEEARPLQQELAGQASRTAREAAALLLRALNGRERFVVHLSDRQATVVYQTLGFHRGRAAWLGRDLTSLYQGLRDQLDRQTV